MGLWTVVNIDTKPVVAELKGIRAAQESLARSAAAILEMLQSPPSPPPTPDEGETQARIDELVEQLRESRENLAAAVAANTNPQPSQ